MDIKVKLEVANFKSEDNLIAGFINELVANVHSANVEAGWWTDLTYQKKVEDLKNMGLTDEAIQAIAIIVGLSEKKQRNVGEALMLITTELAEGMEGSRKGLMDTHLPHRKMLEVELADAIIRAFDLAGGLGMDLGGAIVEKLIYNSKRADHKIENRMKEGGKSC